jgi:hypothetical protein
MKKIVLCVLLVSTFVWAAPNPNEYSVNIHVTSSYFVTSPGRFEGAATVQKLNVLVDGKKYELTALATKTGLLAPGDYKARLVQDEHQTTYESSQEYEFLFPDKKTRKFFVTGQTE